MLFDDVLEARQPELLHELGNRLSEEEVEAQLARYAEPVRNVVPDFFEGSDAALLEGEAVIRERVKTNPQELTVWLRSEASEAEEAHARAEAERTSRPEVRISIRRKRLPAARRPFRVNAAQRGTGSSKRQGRAVSAPAPSVLPYLSRTEPREIEANRGSAGRAEGVARN